MFGFKIIGSFFLGISKWLWNEFESFLKSESAKLIAKLLPYAREVVIMVAANYLNLSDKEKQEKAVELLIEKTKEFAFGYATNLFYYAIEWAYNELRDECKEIEKKEIEKNGMSQDLQSNK